MVRTLRSDFVLCISSVFLRIYSHIAHVRPSTSRVLLLFAVLQLVGGSANMWEKRDPAKAADGRPNPYAKAKASDVCVFPFDEKRVRVPYRRGVAVSSTQEVTLLPFMVATCMTTHRFQGGGFERVGYPLGRDRVTLQHSPTNPTQLTHPPNLEIRNQHTDGQRHPAQLKHSSEFYASFSPIRQLSLSADFITSPLSFWHGRTRRSRSTLRPFVRAEYSTPESRPVAHDATPPPPPQCS